MGKNKNALRLRPLDSAEQRLKISILQQIGEFWTHFKFDLGDAGSLPEIKSWLGDAAEYSILIRNHLLQKNPGTRLFRLVPGSVREYLLNLERFPADSETFIKEVVLALFSNKDGFVAKLLTKTLIDQYVENLLKQALRKDAKAREEIQQVEKEVKDAWNETSKIAQDIFAIVDSLSLSNPSYYRQLVKVLHNLQGLKNQFSKFHDSIKNEKENTDESLSESSSVTEGEKEEKEEEIATEEMNVDNETIAHSKPSEEGEIKVINENLLPPQPTDQNQTEAAPAEENFVPQTQSSPSNDLALRRIASDVGQIQEGLQSLSHDIEILRVEDLVSDPSKNKKFVDDLHRRCVAFSEGLMKDLYTLDELSLSQEERPKRKEQVKKIQSLVTSVDTLLGKLHEMIEAVKNEETKQQEEQRKAEEQKKLEEIKKIEEEKKKREEEKTALEPKKGEIATKKKPTEEDMSVDQVPQPSDFEQILRDALQESLKKKLKTELDFQKKKDFEPELNSQARRLEPIWRRMKLRPKVNVEEASDGYLISAYIPGMKSEDVQISAVQDGQTPVLAIRGHRSPSIEELALIRRQLARSGIEPDDESVVRLGLGRFGTFLEKFAIPSNVDPRRITGGYEGGELRVILPKVVAIPLRNVAPALDPGYFWW